MAILRRQKSAPLPKMFGRQNRVSIGAVRQNTSPRRKRDVDLLGDLRDSISNKSCQIRAATLFDQQIGLLGLS
jgi:hypothetical protein